MNVNVHGRSRAPAFRRETRPPGPSPFVNVASRRGFIIRGYTHFLANRSAAGREVVVYPAMRISRGAREWSPSPGEGQEERIASAREKIPRIRRTNSTETPSPRSRARRFE